MNPNNKNKKIINDTAKYFLNFFVLLFALFIASNQPEKVIHILFAYQQPSLYLICYLGVPEFAIKV